MNNSREIKKIDCGKETTVSCNPVDCRLIDVTQGSKTTSFFAATLSVCSSEKSDCQHMADSRKQNDAKYVTLSGIDSICSSGKQKKVTIESSDPGALQSDIVEVICGCVASGGGTSDLVVGKETVLNETWNGEQVYGYVYEWSEGDSTNLDNAGNLPDGLSEIVDSEYSFTSAAANYWNMEPQYFFRADPIAGDPVLLTVYVINGISAFAIVPDAALNRLVIKYTKA